MFEINPMNTTPSSPKETQETLFSQFSIAVVIPCYRVEREVETVLRAIPSYVRHIIAVNDASPDGTQAVLDRAASEDRRIIIMRHPSNQGVGGAMVSGFKKALELGAQLVVKMDGDGQMAAADLPLLLMPLIHGTADFTKGNRFRDFDALRTMPLARRAGNMALSFLVKAATGYWNCFDPCNGFLAIRGDGLAQLPLKKLHRSYFFETSLLSQLYLINAFIQDVPIPAHYGNEISSLSIKRVLLEFPPRLAVCLMRRLILKNYIYDFNMESLHLLFGLPMFFGGAIYGLYNWIKYAQAGVGAPTGTVVIPAMLIILGFQLLLAAVGADMESVPRRPISGEPLPANPKAAPFNEHSNTPSITA
jgi:dolichol-phosphate mannosyltransferase